MKLNTRVYKKMTGEPFLTQDIDGRVVEFHKMDDSPFLFQYASKGRFAIWASDGSDYKVLIESTYYDAMEAFYSEGVNRIWLNFLERISAINKRINMIFIIPTIIFYAVVAFFASAYFQNQIFVVLLVLLGIIVITNSIQNRVIGKRVKEENTKAQDEIRNLIGAAEFDRLIQNQERHYQTYYEFQQQKQANQDGNQTGDTQGSQGEPLDFEEDLKPFLKPAKRAPLRANTPEPSEEETVDEAHEPLDFEDDLKPFLKGYKKPSTTDKNDLDDDVSDETDKQNKG
ncbi:MAG: hypothetical protein K9K93_01525 [Acholeplasmataceae bacterium]|nr:hypothetical protein [Acholeplasmataceae bacterium]